MRRVVIVGSSGSGKSTLARRVAERRGLRHVELDALFHGPSWTPRPSFVADVDRATAEDGWVVDGNYGPVRELVWARADTVVWLDLPRLQVELQVVRRSFVRWVRREELWNGNREPWPFKWLEPEHPVRWSWTKHAEYRERYAARFADAAFAHARCVRLRSRAAVEAFVRGL
jgi:adenylate kinase family enzyme